jgi:S1-C subfamily serine protease
MMWPHATAGLALLGLSLGGAPAPADTAEDRIGAVLELRAEVPRSARTATSLGTERRGSGVLIDGQGLVVTIGYLILEAQAVDLIGPAGDRIPAEIVGYDHETGLGLVRAASPPAAVPAPLGSAEAAARDTPVIVVSRAGALDVQPAQIVGRRDFAGYWEYLLEDAIFTSPPHAQFGGAALFDTAGDLIGVGSLLVPNAAKRGGSALPGNMFVPIDALEPIFGDLLSAGRRSDPPRPWLGVSLQELGGRVAVARVSPESPAARAGLRRGDLVVAVEGERVRGLADFYRKLWGRGEAGVEVTLTLRRRSGEEQLGVVSGDRYRWLRLDPSL